MESISFNASNHTTLRPEVLNHQTSSPFAKNQIEFHVGSAYLRDFSDKGIEDFLSKHQPSGKGLSAEDVKTFIQRIAANAETAKNISFDLCDPELGLFNDDGIAKRHLDGAFTLNVADRAVLPSSQTGQAGHVRFVDVASASFDVKEKEKEISGYQREIQAIQPKLKEAREQRSATQKELEACLDALNPGAQARLELIQERKQKIAETLAQNESDKADYTEELKKPDLKPTRKEEIKLIMRGLESEKTKLTEERVQLDQQLGAKFGMITMRRTLNDLDKANRDLAAQNRKVENYEAQIQTKLAKIEQVQKRPAEPQAQTQAPEQT
ncbi:MAG TPA: hypothetical protein V6D23_01465, partial [Candidatus Obscuribacterales bacterium]